MIVRSLVAAFLSCMVAAGDPEPQAPKPDIYEQHIFFAVLEGLYLDGVSNEVVDSILAKDEQTGYPANFVWACPACMPAYNAFRVYRERIAFQGKKITRDTFGPGLPAARAERLTAVDLPVRQTALEELIAEWMDRRMKSLRLTDDEQREWRAEMEMRRKEGMSYLAGYRKLGGSYASMKTCPICEGAN